MIKKKEKDARAHRKGKKYMRWGGRRREEEVKEKYRNEWKGEKDLEKRERKGEEKGLM